VSAAGFTAIESAFDGRTQMMKPSKQAAKRSSCRWANIADDSPPNFINRQTGRRRERRDTTAIRPPSSLWQTGNADLFMHRFTTFDRFKLDAGGHRAPIRFNCFQCAGARWQNVLKDSIWNCFLRQVCVHLWPIDSRASHYDCDKFCPALFAPFEQRNYP
jgi:hypothetical protein